MFGPRLLARTLRGSKLLESVLLVAEFLKLLLLLVHLVSILR